MSILDKSIVRKTGIYFIGNFASKIIMAIMIPFYAFFVSVDELGLFDYSQTIMNTVTPIIFLALWESILRFLVAEKDEKKRNNIISTSMRLVLVILLILFAASVATAVLSNNKVTMYTMLMTCFYGAAQIWQYYSRALKFNQIYVMASVTGTILNFVTLIIMICFLKMGGAGLFWSYIIGQISIVVLIELKIRLIKYSVIGKFQWFILKQMLVFSIPLIFNLASGWLISGFGRMVITNQLGAYENGLFSFAMKFGTIISMLGTVVSMALIEEAIIKNEESDIDEYFSNIIQVLFNLFLSISVLAVPCIAVFYYFISNTEFSESYSLAPVFLVYSILMIMSTNVGAIFQARNKTNILFYTTVCGAVVTIILTLLMVNLFGILGVAIAQITGALVLLVTRWFFAKRLIRFSVKWRKVVVLAFLYLALVIACNKGIHLGSIIISVLAISVVVYLNKEIFIEVKKFRNRKRLLDKSLAQ